MQILGNLQKVITNLRFYQNKHVFLLFGFILNKIEYS